MFGVVGIYAQKAILFGCWNDTNQADWQLVTGGGGPERVVLRSGQDIQPGLMACEARLHADAEMEDFNGWMQSVFLFSFFAVSCLADLDGCSPRARLLASSSIIVSEKLLSGRWSWPIQIDTFYPVCFAKMPKGLCPCEPGWQLFAHRMNMLLPRMTDDVASKQQQKTAFCCHHEVKQKTARENGPIDVNIYNASNQGAMALSLVAMIVMKLQRD